VIACAEKLEMASAEMRQFLQTASWSQSHADLPQYLSRRGPHQSNRILTGADHVTYETESSGEMVGASPAYRRMLEDALSVAPTDVTVLLRGETGTGKELLARAIHARSLRSDRPFIIINCPAIPPTLVESELFGYEKGAFTGAARGKPGRFELADGGTIFLNEIGEVPPEVQGRFLCVLQTGVFERLGGAKSIRVNVRIIAATGQPLEHMVDEERFRADLFYRLNVFPITLPPLRRRLADIPMLAQHFVDKYSARFNRSSASISRESLTALQQYHWPGNVRELEHLVERAVLSADGAILKIAPPAIRVEPLPSDNDEPPETGGARRHKDATPLATLADYERDHIRMVLRHTGGRISGPRGAAEILGLPPSTLRSRIKKLGLKIP
jgi:formate hydrogenlyase transcriptional activator